MSSPTSTEVPVKIQAGIRKTGNQPYNAMSLLSPQQLNPVFHAQLQSPAEMSYGPVAGMGNWVPYQDLMRGNMGSPLNMGSNYAGPIFGVCNEGICKVIRIWNVGTKSIIYTDNRYSS